MKLATFENGHPDGRLSVVSADGRRAAWAPEPFATLQAALESWSQASPALGRMALALDAGSAQESFALDPARLLAPLPRAYQWLDGSAFLSHSHLMTLAFNMDSDPALQGHPLMYQGLSDHFLSPHQDAPFRTEADGIDFEAEFGVIVDAVPMGVSAAAALDHIKLIVIINDWSLRIMAPREMRSGFGFVQAKPACSLGPLAVTPEALGSAWRDGRVHLAMSVTWNGAPFGQPRGEAMSYGFGELIAHAAATRRLSAGTLIGSGTVSNPDAERVGSACISERRALEMIATGGAPQTSFMRFGDRVRIEALDAANRSVFGAIDQRVVEAAG